MSPIRRTHCVVAAPEQRKGRTRFERTPPKHGLRAEVLGVLPDENAEEFADRLAAWTSDFGVETDAEAFLIRQLVGQSWRLDRLDQFDIVSRSRQIHEAMDPSMNPDDPKNIEAARFASFDPSIEGERLRRYQFALLREMRRTLDSFRKVRELSLKPREEEGLVQATNKPNSECAVSTQAPAPNKPNLEPMDHKQAPAPNKPNLEPMDHKQAPASNKPNLNPVATPEASAPNKPNLMPAIPRQPAPNKANLIDRDRPRSSLFATIGGKVCVLAETSLLSPRPIR